ncbi:MAG: ArsR family transcriptional regulator [Holophagae bacterium]|nr:ArsR family transcriptional regulator [Holophagae bacterium]
MSQDISIIPRALASAETAVPGLVWQKRGEALADGSSVCLSLNGNELQFVVLLSPRVPHMASLQGLRKRAKALLAGQRPLVITEGLTAEMFSRFIKADFPVLDTLGGVFLHHDSTYICIPPTVKSLLNGKKRQAITPLPETWGPAALRLIFGILAKPEILQQTVRELAGEFSVSMGTASHTLRRLREQGFVLSVEKGRPELRQRQKLTEIWLGQYGQLLRPSLVIGRYRPADDNFIRKWKKETPTGLPILWGGEAAADFLTHNLVPATFILYTQKTKVPLLLNSLKLIPDRNGYLELHEQFWDHRPWQQLYPRTAHPLLVYADLLQGGDTRLLEIAEEIHEHYLSDFTE